MLLRNQQGEFYNYPKLTHFWLKLTWKQILTRKHKVGNFTMNLETSILGWKISFQVNNDVFRLTFVSKLNIRGSKLILFRN